MGDIKLYKITYKEEYVYYTPEDPTDDENLIRFELYHINPSRHYLKHKWDKICRKGEIKEINHIEETNDSDWGSIPYGQDDICIYEILTLAPKV